MMDKKYFKKIARDLFKHSRGLKTPTLIHPAREWFTGLFIAVMVFAGSAAWGGATYFHHKNLTISGGETQELEKVVYRESLVKAALEGFASRANKYAELTDQSYVPVVEPAPEPEVLVESEVDKE